MPVEVDTVRAVSVPTRLVHGPGAVASLAAEVAALGMARPMLVTDPGVAAAGLVERVLPQLNGVVTFDEVRPNPDVALVDRARSLSGRRLRRPRRARRRLVDGHGEGDRSRRTPRGLDRVVRVGARPDRASHPAARGDPDDRRDGKRGDALGRDHGSRAPDQVQRRRHAADRGARRADRPGADARPAGRGDGGDRDGRALARHRVLHVRLPPAVQRRRRVARDRARRPVAPGRGRGRVEPRGAHADGTCGDARRHGVRHRERRRRSCDEPVGRRRTRLPARRAHGARARPRLRVQRAGRAGALRAHRPGPGRRHRRHGRARGSRRRRRGGLPADGRRRHSDDGGARLLGRRDPDARADRVRRPADAGQPARGATSRGTRRSTATRSPAAGKPTRQ